MDPAPLIAAERPPAPPDQEFGRVIRRRSQATSVAGRDDDELDAVVRRLVVEAMDGLGIDAASFVGRERARANFAFLQMLREQHEERGREFRRGLFQNSGNLLALALMSSALLAGGWLLGHGLSLK